MKRKLISGWRSGLFAVIPSLLIAPSAFAQDADGDGVPDAADAYPTNAAWASEAFAPAEESHGMMMVEDQFPSRGDLDFNDLVIGYNFHALMNASGQVVRLRASFSVLAVGGVFTNGLGLHLPVPASSVASVVRRIDEGAAQTLTPSGADAQLTVRVLDNLRTLFGGTSGPINALGTLARRESQTLAVQIDFATPVALGVGAAPYDLFIFRSEDPTHEIHRPQFAGTAAMNAGLFGTADDGSTSGRWFVDTQGLPFAITLPTLATYPRESTELAALFPNVVTFAASGGTAAQDFYVSNVATENAYRDVDGRAPLPPLMPMARLFDRETFAGNGRTCVTCHGVHSGTISPQDAQLRFADDPSDPLFLHDGSDDGLGSGVSRITSRATILVDIELPPQVALTSNPTQRTVTLARAVPTTVNSPPLDTVLMFDGRAATLELQAESAILGHAQATRNPTGAELAEIALFESTATRFFSSDALRQYARGGPEPVLPPGSTAAEVRGRAFFLPNGPCGWCHSGPMLNETSSSITVVPVGTRFMSAFVSELNLGQDPIRQWTITRPDNSTTTVSSADPGRVLVTGAVADVNRFKTTSLWGVGRTAPYFHNNSAPDLNAVVQHYVNFFRSGASTIGRPPITLSPQQAADILAYLQILAAM